MCLSSVHWPSVMLLCTLVLLLSITLDEQGACCSVLVAGPMGHHDYVPGCSGCCSNFSYHPRANSSSSSPLGVLFLVTLVHLLGALVPGINPALLLVKVLPLPWHMSVENLLLVVQQGVLSSSLHLSSVILTMLALSVFWWLW